MMAFELHRDKGVLVIEPRGALSTDDFREVARLVDPYILSRKASFPDC